jgi:hypothetical protein
MFEFAAFTYGLLASYVLASIGNNSRAARPNPKLLTLFGWGLMAFSLTLALLLGGYAVYSSLVGATG